MQAILDVVLVRSAEEQIEKNSVAPDQGLEFSVTKPMKQPRDVQVIGEEIAILWQDGEEDYFPMPFLREFSPSAENIGEMDVLGNVHGGTGPRKYPGVTIKNWEFLGNYAIRFDFSDGHDTGLYSFDYLIGLRKHLKDWSVKG